MIFVLTPVYKDIFIGEPIPASVEDIIKGIPTEAVIKSCCYINSILFFKKNTFDEECKIFVHLIERLPDAGRRNAYYKRLQEFSKRTKGSSVAIFPLIHTLKLLEVSLLNYTPGVLSDLTEEQELSILKALLFLNTKSDDKLTIAVNQLGASSGNTNGLYKMLWSSLLNSSTFQLNKDFIICIYKALHFLRYLKAHFPTYCEQYLAANKVENPESILIKIFELYINGYQKDKDIFSFNFPAGSIKDNPVIDQFVLPVESVSKTEYSEKEYDKNLKGIRTFPIIKFPNGDYSISNWKFIAEKFYEGLVFDFYNKSGIKDQAEYSSFGNFKTKIGEIFSQGFFSTIMKEIFVQPGIITFKEKERNTNCDYDFYIRIRNQIFIFEFKDLLFPLKETYEEIKNNLNEKLSGKKGIAQLNRQIINLVTNPQQFDDCFSSEYPLERIFIYPIIIYTDNSYGITGVNDYLDEQFSQLVPKDIRGKLYYISPLIMVPFDFFLEYYDELKEEKMDLVEIITSYLHIKSGRKEFYRRWPSSEIYPSIYDGFDTITSTKYQSFRRKSTKTTFFEYIMSEFTPHLPPGKDDKQILLET